MTRMWPLIIVFIALGCAPVSHGTVRSRVDVMRAERTADKMLERGRAFASIGDHTRAEQYLSAAIDAGSDPAEVLPLLIRVCVEGDRHLVALDYARNYLQKDPDNERLRFLVASLESALGQNADALEELRALTESHPDDPNLHFTLAALVRDSGGDPEEADRHFREYLRLSPAGQHAAEAQRGLLREVR